MSALCLNIVAILEQAKVELVVICRDFLDHLESEETLETRESL